MKQVLQNLTASVERALEEVNSGLSSKFRPFELSKLLEGGYVSAERIRAASRESLCSLSLPPAAIDLLFATIHPPRNGTLPLEVLHGVILISALHT